MKIRYLGHSCFEIASKKGSVIVTDPYRDVGYSMPKGLKADILTVSHRHFDHNYTQGVEANLLFYGFVGERKVERNGECIKIRGISSYHDPEQGALRGKNVIYIIEVDGVTLCHMGDIGEECSPSLVEKIGKIDCLFIPVGGTYTVDATGAKKYVDALSPKVVFPMHYKPKDGSLDITDASSFLALYEGNYASALDGEIVLDKGDKGMIYMERVK